MWTCRMSLNKGSGWRHTCLFVFFKFECRNEYRKHQTVTDSGAALLSIHVQSCYNSVWHVFLIVTDCEWLCDMPFFQAEALFMWQQLLAHCLALFSQSASSGVHGTWFNKSLEPLEGDFLLLNLLSLSHTCMLHDVTSLIPKHGFCALRSAVMP